MIIGIRRALLLVFIGDMVAFTFALYLTLWLRYIEIPTFTILEPYLIPFAFLFILWILVLYSAGLYSKRLMLFPNRLPDALLKTQLANILFAALFFFLVPGFGLAPKTILVLYWIVSLALLFMWRLGLYPRLMEHRTPEHAILLAEGDEANQLFEEVNGNPRYRMTFIARSLGGRDAPFCIIDEVGHDPALVSRLLREGKQIISFIDFYEEVFDRIPLSRLNTLWFRDNAVADSLWYSIVKRGVDIVGGVVMGLITILITPVVALANSFEGEGELFIAQERLGKNGVRILAYKFRSMQKNIVASGEWTTEGANRITRVGQFLRTTSLDEFPQCINILRGELSLIGPRNDIRGLGERLAQSLPYYMERYHVLPGITGWAQINQQYEPGNVSPQSIEETKTRLAYDFYYLKHRSVGLDIIIALKTIKRMFFRVSSW